MSATVPQAVQSCHEVLLRLIPQLVKFSACVASPWASASDAVEQVPGNSPFIRFDELTAGFESLRTNGAVIETTGVFRSC